MNKEGGGPDGFRNYRFKGSAFDGLALVVSTDHEALSAWGRWLKAEGYPALSEFPITRQGSKPGIQIFELPWKQPPDDAAKADEAHAFFSSMIEPEELRYAAQ